MSTRRTDSDGTRVADDPGSPRRVLIAGAGPAGLTAAYELGRRGHAPVVYEKDAVVGGHARTAVYRGYRFDMGGHRFFTKMPRIERIWDDLMGEEMLRVPRLSRIYYNQKFFHYPLRIGDVLSGLGLWDSSLIGLSYLRAVMFPRRDEKTFEDWVVNRFGYRLYSTFFKSYTEKVWGIPCDQIGADWAAQRIKGLSVRAALLHALFGHRSRGAKSLIHEFRYPRLGPGQLWERMAVNVERMGGQVLRERPVRRILRTGTRVDGFAVGQQEEVVTGTSYIGSMPMSLAVRMMDPPPPADVQKAAAALKHRDFLTVNVIVDVPDLFPDNWIYIHEPAVHMGRLQNYKNWSPDMVPNPRTTSLGAEYFVTRGDRLWEMDDADLIALTAAELETLGLVSADRIEDGVVYRRLNAYPMYDGDYRAHLRTLERFFKSFVNLQMVGRSGLHKYNNQDHSMLTALLAVENLHGAAHDIWAVNTDDEYHEQGGNEAHA